MTPGEKYSVKISDSEIESYKETFRMFDKVQSRDIIRVIISTVVIRMVTAQCPPRSWGQS